MDPLGNCLPSILGRLDAVVGEAADAEDPDEDLSSATLLFMGLVTCKELDSPALR